MYGEAIKKVRCKFDKSIIEIKGKTVETFSIEIGEDDDSRVEIEFVRTGEKTQ